jgi:hypothetical protein
LLFYRRSRAPAQAALARNDLANEAQVKAFSAITRHDHQRGMRKSNTSGCHLCDHLHCQIK